MSRRYARGVENPTDQLGNDSHRVLGHLGQDNRRGAGCIGVGLQANLGMPPGAVVRRSMQASMDLHGVAPAMVKSVRSAAGSPGAM